MDSISFLFRKFKDEYLNHQAGIEDQIGNYAATPEKVVVDMQYFNPHYHIDYPGVVDFENVKLLQRAIDYMIDLRIEDVLHKSHLNQWLIEIIEQPFLC